ncbi:IS66 family insertion sequence element accessory protein TnpB [Pullulanibacillus sp. KACC 23026]|uniref:IS66 family insertion sequence element accessory protein TnpA n=1 Tax=Pullulanibacillus sp. KACC 23026 TaxID=3028315 RepID=UPI0023AF63A9|nr:IS66 family insertion sequence element accessory protein TnpB [Pullulanibacillus sp. KACC 23026]WEG13648.1 IS66 family insertion sequence element accessory protein TnpB [Pullulanibacillus sp. KACC 23026]
MTHSEKQIEWKTRVDAWKTSGLGITQWCQEQGIKRHQMHYWIRKFKEETTDHTPSSPQWLTLTIKEEQLGSQGPEPVFIHFGPISIEVRPGSNLTLVSDLV